MTRRIVERELMEAIESMTEDLYELNYMIQNLNTDINTIRLFFAEQRRARENGENNE